MSVLNLDGIKDGIKNILDTANTTTATLPLSTGMTNKITKVLQVNPARIPVQSTLYPYVTVYLDAKQIEEKTINRDQASGRRRAELDLKIIGAVWNSTVADPALDKASEECEVLMENIEQILRSDPKLSATADWSFPTGVTYHNVYLEEGASLRAGIMTYRVVAHY